MTQRERSIVAFCLAWGLFFLNLAGGYFSWYSGLWWYDMPMHFLGGIMIATVALLYAFSLKWPIFGMPQSPNYGRLFLVILAVVVFWEALEYGLSTQGGNAFHLLDSMSDISLGLGGALFVLSSSAVVVNDPIKKEGIS